MPSTLSGMGSPGEGLGAFGAAAELDMRRGVKAIEEAAAARKAAQAAAKTDAGSTGTATPAPATTPAPKA